MTEKREKLGIREYIQGTAIHYLRMTSGENQIEIGATSSPDTVEAFCSGAPIEDYFEKIIYSKSVINKIDEDKFYMGKITDVEFHVFVSFELMERIRTDKTNVWTILRIFREFNKGNATFAKLDPFTGEPRLDE